MATRRDQDAAVADPFFKEEMLSRPFGGNGIRYISGTTPVTGLSVFWITCLTDTVFTTLTGISGFSVTGMTGPTFAAGSTIAGRFSDITLASGSITVNHF